MASSEPTPAHDAADSRSHEVFPHSIQDILERLAGPPLALREVIVTRRIPARHSELLELRAGDRAILVKHILRSRSAAIAAATVDREFRALVAMRGAPWPLAGTIPEPLAHFPELHALAMSRLPGVTLAARMRGRANRLAAPWSGGILAGAAAAAGRWLREFHEATGRGDRAFEPAPFLSRLEPVIERCGRSSPSGTMFLEIAERVRRGAESLAGYPEPIAARHGDFIPQNVLLEGAEPWVGIVDFENFESADAVFYDLASFVAYLRLMRGNPLYSGSALRAVEERFLQGYGAHESVPIALHTLSAALRHAAEVDTSTPRGRERRRRVDEELQALSLRLDAAPRPGRAPAGDRVTNKHAVWVKPTVTPYAVGMEGYQDVASYDELRYAGPANEYKQLVMSNAYRRLIGPLDGKAILDVGCGTGRGVADFSTHARWAVGADASLDMLRFAAKKMNGRNNWSLARSYAQALPFATGSFDVVTSLNFLHLFRESTQAVMIAEMKRVLKPGGIMVLEFDNALQGGVIGLYKRYTGREHGSLPAEIERAIGGGVRVAKVYGGVFPVVWRLFHKAPALCAPLEKLAYVPPFNRLAHRVYYKIVKE